ncbi:hypothetical protein [Myxococcus virescens]|uniref:Uncharacterized protein n=1 Tax=Myxococcus virescens TaxID=83456 RepID=A0A511HNN1_9BACT|nr:hypothetical protein [Myxococcus virescens]GEL75203.1 hypothetical protein MVI01_69870 [Myxococcus virescens]SDD65156.1 hypothetical protein SAMN04488504_102128 [Myxococcus virescens]
MSGGPRFYDSGSYIAPKFSSISVLTAGGAGDNVAVVGASIDRMGFGSSAVAVTYSATLAAAATLSITVQREQSDDGTTWEAATTVLPAQVVATGPGGGGTVRGEVKLRESYETAARFVRYSVTPNLSASATDTASVACTVVLGGAFNGTSLPLS